MEIKYETSATGLFCLTPCPNNGKLSETPVKVGAGFCMVCKYFGGKNRDTQTVTCNYGESKQ